MKTSWTLAVLVIVPIAVCSAYPRQDMMIEKGVDSLSNVVEKYQKEFDDEFQFREIQSAIDVMDKSMLGFHGTAKGPLDNVRSLNSEAYLTYERSSGSVLEWCVAINSSLDLFIGELDNENIPSDSKNVLWKILVKGLNLGAKNIIDSMVLLEEVQAKRTNLRETLESMQEKLEFDLLQEMKEMDTVTEESWYKKLYENFVGFFKKLFGEQKTDETDLTAEKIRIKYDILGETIRNATRFVKTPLNLHLEEDKSHLNQMIGVIEVAEAVTQQVVLGGNKKLQSKLVPHLSKLGTNCSQYQQKIVSKKLTT